VWQKEKQRGTEKNILRYWKSLTDRLKYKSRETARENSKLNNVYKKKRISIKIMRLLLRERIWVKKKGKENNETYSNVYNIPSTLILLKKKYFPR